MRHDPEETAAKGTVRQRMACLWWYGYLRMQGRVARSLRRVIMFSHNSAADIALDFRVPPERLHVTPVGVDLPRPITSRSRSRSWS
jgi:hypothetical protein